jgi:nifR3 family TIM-barrel protein
MLPDHYLVRDVRIAPNLVLAPMEGVTDLTFRRLVRQIGGTGLTVTEFIASEGLRRGVAKTEHMARFDPDERPVAIQIYGRNPEAMAEAAAIVEESGATLCDINMGCPSKKVCAHSGGSALMRDLPLATEIVRAVRKAITIPLTVKMRSGFDHENRNAPELAWICQEEGAEAITIHWRTRADLYGGTRAVDKIAETKARLRVPVIGNGDIVNAQSARRMFEETGVDGVMIGRGAIKNPWVFRQVAAELRGEAPMVVDAAEKRRVLLGYFESIRAEFHTDRSALGRMKKIANYFTHGLPHGSELRHAFLHSMSIEQAIDHTETFFANLQAFEAGEPWRYPGDAVPDVPVAPLEPGDACEVGA